WRAYGVERGCPPAGEPPDAGRRGVSRPTLGSGRRVPLRTAPTYAIDAATEAYTRRSWPYRLGMRIHPRGACGLMSRAYAPGSDEHANSRPSHCELTHLKQAD